MRNINQVCASIKLSTSNKIDKIEKTKKTGKDCLRLLPANVMRADSSVMFDVSPFV